MNNRDKENILKEKLKQALVSTARVISEDFVNKISFFLSVSILNSTTLSDDKLSNLNVNF